ncbi:hypothetical protein [Mycetocola zhadangensis]|uniref:Uncharacterized protein n=1 Tax=Mycetocola zhadangensis TaxID=1164595 RepID=A0A3L7J1Z6_9MICO|nr:hypothetical protein [Mycetocola zhadangensis]RLQ84583.1 hypothetical protein D9V28_10490 [Mycetocola zhadangensis]GGE91670.1 hypothetical protein GCM10011313_13200 [Mycetocola zhadangensis]
MTGRASRLALVAIVTTLALAVAILVISTVLDTLPGSGSTAKSPSNSSVSSESTADATPDDGEAESPSESTEENSATEESGTGAPSERESSEVMPAPDGKSPIGLPPSPPLPNLVSTPLPPTASAAGGLVEGFPAAVIPLNPNTAVQSSSVASAENRLQVTLAASTPSATDAVLEFYRVSFAALHLVDSVAPAASGSTALLFTRGGPDTVLLTVTPDGSGGTTYSVFGAFTATK